MTDLDRDYQRAGFLGRLGFGSAPAVLVVDAVAAYVDSGSPMYLTSGAAAVDAMSELLAAAREKGVPVAFTRVEYDSADGTDAPLFFKKVPSLKFLEAGSPLGQIAGRIAPRADETVFAKKYASAFFGTTLATWLANNRVDTVLITGFSTSGCVRASALDTLQHGFRPIVVREACADREGGPHEANLFDLDAKYADVVALSDALEYLRSL